MTIFSRTAARRSTGFSLVELLVVIAIVGILGVVSGPMISSIGGGRNSERMGGEILTCLELARSEAMAKNTFVWVGFTNSLDSGSRVLRVAVVASKDGTTNASSSNLFPIVKPLTLRDGRISDDSQAQSRGAKIRALVDGMSGGGTPVNPLSARTGDKAGIGALQMGANTYSDTITFTPQGEVLLSGAPTSRSVLDSFLVLYLQRMHGEAETEDFSAILVNGASGGAQLIRER